MKHEWTRRPKVYVAWRTLMESRCWIGCHGYRYFYDSSRMITKTKSCCHIRPNRWMGAKTEWKWRPKIHVGAKTWKSEKRRCGRWCKWYTTIHTQVGISTMRTDSISNEIQNWVDVVTLHRLTPDNQQPMPLLTKTLWLSNWGMNSLHWGGKWKSFKTFVCRLWKFPVRMVFESLNQRRWRQVIGWMDIALEPTCVMFSGLISRWCHQSGTSGAITQGAL